MADSKQFTRPLSSAGQSGESRAFSLAMGGLLIFAAVVVNKWAIEYTLIPDQHIYSKAKIGAIFVGQAGLLVAGLWILLRRPFLRLTVLSGLAGFGLLLLAGGGLYGSVKSVLPSPWEASGLTMTERLEMASRDLSLYPMRSSTYRRLSKLPVIGNRFEVRKRLALTLLADGKNQAAVLEFERLLRRLELQENISRDTVSSIRNNLAIAHMRMGEQENCIQRHNPEMCLLPIRGSGVHTVNRGFQAAIKELSAVLQDDPQELNSRWLLNIAYMGLGQYPDKVPPEYLIPPDVFESDYDIKQFNDVAPDLGLNVFSLAGGSIMEDFDGDEYLDLMVSSTGLSDQLRYFRNNGDGTFTERTVEAGLRGQTGGLNLVHADYNNDGYPDVLVLRGGWSGIASGNGNHPNSLLHNNGDGTFTDVTERAGLLGFHPSGTAAWGDYNNDGWIDLFIGNESFGRDVHASELFLNNGDGTFSEGATSAGIHVKGVIKGSAWGDFDNDGLLDLYISRYAQPNVLYRNNGNTGGHWSFTDVTEQARVSEPRFSFPTWFWDYDNDGWLDIFVTGFGGPSFRFVDGDAQTRLFGDIAAAYLDLPMHGAEGPRLYRNNQDGTFSDVTRSVGVDKIFFTMGANYGDIDNDGYLDFYLGTGAPSYRAIMPNRMLRSVDGKTFQDVTTSGGFGHLQKGHGISFGDIDNDGDQDIYAEMGGWYEGDRFYNALFENPGHGNRWITLHLEGSASNRSALGSRIKVTVDTPQGKREIYATVGSGGSFGASSLRQEIGLGQARSISQLEITWPATGRVQRFTEVPLDRIFKIREDNPALIHVSAPLFDLSPGALK